MFLLAIASGSHSPGMAQDLESQLKSINPSTIAQQAKQTGDASRGALLFHQPHIGCVRCHSVGALTQVVGPDLTKFEPNAIPTDEDLVESILLPSKKIRKGFETYTVLTSAGQSLSGWLSQRTEIRIVLRDANGQAVEIAAEDVEATKESSVSAMPAGQVNQMATVQQFLDLIRYLIEIRDGGPARAQELQPSPSMLVHVLPEYEAKVDHAALVRDSSKQVLKQGEAIYQRVCANCHGTIDQPGSLPTSLRFAEGKFKNGSDPHSMYRTMTHGFGMMTPQIWMVPKQKYAVIHYIREAYLRDRNPTQWTEITSKYMDSLPKGDTLGPEPSKIEPWSSMDYGPYLTHTYEVPGKKLNIAYKGTAIRLDPGAGGVARGNRWMLWDADTLRWAAGWQAGEGSRFIDWRGIQFNGEHGIHPRVTGEVVFANAIGPGWVDPKSGSLDDDQRVEGRDGRRYGPLPKGWGKYRGLHRNGDSVMIEYQVGETVIFEQPAILPSLSQNHGDIFVRRMLIGPRSQDLVVCVADSSSESMAFRCGAIGATYEWIDQGNRLLLKIKASDKPSSLTIGIARDNRPRSPQNERAFFADLEFSDSQLPTDLEQLRSSNATSWGPEIETTVQTINPSDGPFAVDYLTWPESNPWLAQIRLTGLDFFPDGRMAVCSWDGDVWIATPTSTNETQLPAKLKWKRIASGMFQPLGIKIVDQQIYVTCRDQITKLSDVNGDGDIDFYECFNNDHQVTEHFHEFAMGLQRDEAGNFYYAKSARHALKAIVPHHGTLLKVSSDGSRTEIIANGFRAANGVCLNPDGSFVVTDQEGHWNPKNRINWVRPGEAGKPRFYGNIFGYSDVTDSSDEAMEKPLCWITNDFDRSPGELLWVESKKWGALNGSLLNLSYGTGKVFLVPHETVGGNIQGGMIELPIPGFPTGVMRGRFNPLDGQLYLCGMFAWAGNAQQPGGLYRIRATGREMHLPVELHCSTKGIELEFSSAVDPASIRAENFSVKTWSLRRTANYGSKHFDEADLEIASAVIDKDGKSVRLEIPKIQATWCMEIQYRLQTSDGKPLVGKIHNTIHSL